MGCAVVPRAIFTIGINDSVPETLAVLLPITLLPACLAALWWRRLASLWLLIIGLVWIYGSLWQRHYIFAVRHFPPDRFADTLGRGAMPAYFTLAIATFGLITEHRGWPNLIQRHLP